MYMFSNLNYAQKQTFCNVFAKLHLQNKNTTLQQKQ